MSDHTDTTNTTDNPNRYTAEELTPLVDRTYEAVVTVTITPRDVALLTALQQGNEQTTMGERFGVHKATILKSITRLYAKLGVTKATESLSIAGRAGAITFDDAHLTDQNLIDLYAADDDWTQVGIAVLTDKDKAAPVDSNGKSTPVEVRQATEDEADAMAADAAAASKRNKQASGVNTDK